MRKACRENLQSPAWVNPSVLKAPDEAAEGEDEQQVDSIRATWRSVKSISGPDGARGAPGSAARGKCDKEVRVLATGRGTRVQARSEHGLITQGRWRGGGVLFTWAA